jgi:AcrR family transcriptional regulator
LLGYNDTDRLSVCQLKMPTKSERAFSTRAKIIAIARRLFAANGYEGTSTEAVLKESGVSRGALYHHFENKEALFAAVLEAVEVDITAATARARANVADPLEALRVAFSKFLDLAREPEVRQIVLIDAHSVVGWQKWREIEERHGLGRLKQALKMIAATGRLREDTVDVLAHILLASLIEVAFLVARSPDPAATADKSRAAMEELLERVLGASG